MNSLRGRMPWVFTRRHRTLHACRYRIFAAYASAENPSATYGRQGAGKHGSLTDESVLVRPTDAQKPEPCGPVRSATGANGTPSEHWHPAIWEHACTLSDVFPSLAPCIVAISSPGCSPSRPLALPPSHRQTPSPSLRSFLSSSATQTRRQPHEVHKHSFRLLLPGSVHCVAFQSASRTKCRVLTWPVGCQAKQVDGTIPLDHDCPFPQP